MALAMKCQINNLLNPDLPQHKPGSPWENWSLPTTSQLHLFCTAWSPLRTVLNPASWWLYQSGDSDAAACCYRDVGPNWPNNKHGLEDHLWHVGSTTSTVASLRVATLGWLPSQANLCMLAGIELDKYATGHEMSNQQWWLPATSQLHLFLHCRISI